MPYIEIQRQSYIADIRASLSETEAALKSCEADIKQIDDLIEYCKANKLRKFRRHVVMLERKIATDRKKELLSRKKVLIKLLIKAEKYAPGKGWRP